MLLAAATLLFTACTKDITVDLPDYPEQLVVEGTIEPGVPPIVILTRTQSYFAPTDLNATAPTAATAVAVRARRWRIQRSAVGQHRIGHYGHAKAGRNRGRADDTFHRHCCVPSTIACATGRSRPIRMAWSPSAAAAG